MNVKATHHIMVTFLNFVSVAILFNILPVGSRAIEQQIYQAWAKIFQDIEDNFLRPVLKHPIDLWPNGIMMNYSHLEVGQLPLDMHNYLLSNMSTFRQWERFPNF